jgi:hypothetical protein
MYRSKDVSGGNSRMQATDCASGTNNYENGAIWQHTTANQEPGKRPAIEAESSADANARQHDQLTTKRVPVRYS